MKETVKAILFDMDGVLVNSERVMTRAAILALNEYGVNAKEEDFIPFVGTGEDRFIGGVAKKYGLDYIASMKDRAYDIYDTIIYGEVGKYESAVPVLEYLKNKNYLMAVCSAADRRKVLINLKAAGIDTAFFNAVLTGNDVVNKKPAPDIFLKGAESLKVSPSGCIVIEDAINGIKAAKAAGCTAIGITTSFDSKALKAAGADYVITDLSELMNLL